MMGTQYYALLQEYFVNQFGIIWFNQMILASSLQLWLFEKCDKWDFVQDFIGLYITKYKHDLKSPIAIGPPLKQVVPKNNEE